MAYNPTKPQKFNPVLLASSADLLACENRIRIRKARERLERIIAAQVEQAAEWGELPRRGYADLPLNLLSLARARMPHVAGFRDLSEGDSDEGSVSETDSWETVSDFGEEEELHVSLDGHEGEGAGPTLERPDAPPILIEDNIASTPGEQLLEFLECLTLRDQSDDVSASADNPVNSRFYVGLQDHYADMFDTISSTSMTATAQSNNAARPARDCVDVYEYLSLRAQGRLHELFAGASESTPSTPPSDMQPK